MKFSVHIRRFEDKRDGQYDEDPTLLSVCR